jgi:hypothetical protein
MSITQIQAEHQFKRLFTVYPSYRAFLESAGDSNATLDAWCKIISECEQDDVEAVVDEIVSGKREAVGRYEKQDQLPFNLRAEAMARKTKREQSQTQEEMYHKPIREKRLGAYGRKETSSLAVKLGAMVKAKQITREEGAERLDYLIDVWDKGGEDPDWIEKLRTVKGQLWTDVSKWKLNENKTPIKYRKD